MTLPELDPTAAIKVLQARGPGRMVPDLHRITALTELLGHPQSGYDAVHVSGTNGKTSTATMISAFFTAAGLTCGQYSSPHLQALSERIRVAGVPIDGEDLARHVTYLQPFLDAVDAEQPDKVTYFEALTAVALLHFADAPVDVAVFEVGMGGKWDATNVVDARVATLLPVTLDHLELGSTPAEIAREKVGIIKPDAHVVAAAQDAEVMAVLQQRVDAMNATCKVAGRDFELLGRTPAVNGQQIDLQGVQGTYHEIFLPLFGRHQANNALLALVAYEAYHHFEVELDPDLVQEALASVRVPGRLEPVPQGEEAALVVLDGAHNPAGMAALAEAIRHEFGFERRVVVLGVLDDKDVEAIVAALAGTADHVIAVAPDSPRAADPDRIVTACGTHAISVETAVDVEEALDLAAGVTRPADGVVVTGSLYLVGEARDALGLDPA